MPGVLQSGFARLTRAEYRATIKEAFGLDADVSGIPEDGRVGPYTSNIAFASDPVQPFLLASEDLAALIVPSRLPTCTAATASTCISTSYSKPFERLFRRPVAATELAAWSTMLGNLEKAGLTAESATRAMVTSALLQPDAMFRTTPLAGDAARARRLAEHLSYALWDAPPDAELAAVGTGTRRRSWRPPGHPGRSPGPGPRAVPVLARFMAQWLHVDLDLKLAADAAYATSPLYLELLAFVQDALSSGVPVTSFVNGTRGFVHRNNLAPYGLTVGVGNGRRGGRDLARDLAASRGDRRRGDHGSDAASRRRAARDLPGRAGALVAALPDDSAAQRGAGGAGRRGDRPDERCAAAWGATSCSSRSARRSPALDRDFTGTAPAVQLNSHDELAGTYAALPAFLDAIAGSRAFADCFARQMWAFFLEQPLAEVDAASIAEIAAIVRSGGSLGDVVSQMAVSLEARSRTVVPWCEGP